VKFPILLALCLCTSVCVQPASPQAASSAHQLSNAYGNILNLDSTILTLPLGPTDPPLQITLRQAMDLLHDPGLSITVVDQYQILWARGYGVTGPGSASPVTSNTLFQAASISKTFTAVGALWLVERGKLNLDQDVNTELTTWHLPENNFTTVQKVTLRRLMSHNAGINVGGFNGYPIGAPLPSLAQILNGEPPANSPPIRVDTVPGTLCRYSGGGVTIERALIDDATHEPFADFLNRTVLRPSGMTDSTFAQPLPASLIPRAATGTRADGTPIPGKFYVYPELAPDGLWSTPTDLARFAIEIALSKHGKANHILSKTMTREMLTKQASGDDGTYGLGFGVGDSPNPDLFIHNGANQGFQSKLLMLADSGQGIALMGNSDNFHILAPYIVETIARSYGWKLAPDLHPALDSLIFIQAARGTPVALAAYQRMAQAGFPGMWQDVSTLNIFGYQTLRQQKIQDAILIFQRNVTAYSSDFNTYDSLGEAYMDAGQKDLAIQNYEKSLQLNPKNDNAIVQLRKLQAQKP